MTASSQNTAAPPASAPGGLASLVSRATGAMERLPWSVPAVALRIFPAAVFWQSGRTKVEGFGLADSTVFLFEHEYALPVIDPALAAYLATAAEHVFPVLLVLGLATRVSALALLVMTLVIQVFVYPGAWVTHGLWAACFLALIAKGPGALSLDRLIARRAAA
ncbi:DoxX family protein [Salinarimonas sp. NSM]|uniref:DoxX family protein n=1 Tax=Salinarimonas sp. NSM TaxID=3458003 RepID=UPI0040371EC7